jgi:hypothetical protein
VLERVLRSVTVAGMLLALAGALIGPRWLIGGGCLLGIAAGTWLSVVAQAEPEHEQGAAPPQDEATPPGSRAAGGKP